LPFGIEIVVERVGYRPKIALARKIDNVIEVTSLDPAVTYATDDATYFMHWHAKEECLNFIDPCALWGSFFAAKLRVWNSGGTTFDRKTGNDIYDAVLRGSYDDTSATAGNFYNRNIIYLDIRNEHDKSFNYYQTNGDTILATFDPSAPIETTPRSYHSGGWPIFRTDQSVFPSSLTGSVATLRLSFSLGNYNCISVYGSPRRKGRRQKTSPSKIQLDYSLPDTPVGPELEFDYPVYGSAPPRSISSYTSLSVFIFEKKSIEDMDEALEQCPWSAPHGIPFEAFEIPFARPNSISVKTFSETYLLHIPFISSSPTVYNIGWVAASAHSILFLSPAAFDATDIGAPLTTYSANLARSTLLDAASHVTRPFKAVLRQTDSGSYYADYSLSPTSTTRVPQSAFGRFMLFLSAQSLNAIQLAKAPNVATLVIAPMPTGQDAQRLMIAARGLRTENAVVVAFLEPLDAGTSSNVDAD